LTDNQTTQKIFDVIMAFYDKQDYFDLLDVILTKMMELTQADAGTLYIVDDEHLHFRIMKTISLNIFQGARDIIDLPPVSLDDSNTKAVSAYAALRNEIVNIADVYDNTDFNFSGPMKYDKLTGYRTQSMLVFPLTSRNGDTEEVIGVIQLINSINEKTGEVQPFTDDICEPTFLQALSNISANALANLQYAKELKEMLESFVKVMTKAIDERSPYNVNHTNNVAKYCGDFARYLSGIYPHGHKYYFSENRTENLIMAAFLHDIGKIITPLEIMDKANRLSDVQLELIGYKYELKKAQLEVGLLNGSIANEKYNDEIEYINEAYDFICEVNISGFIPNEKIAQIKDYANITYKNKSGGDELILSEENIDALTVQRGTLTEKERETMQEHVSVTGRLLGEMNFKKHHREIPNWAMGHHEYIDGTGYPLGLSGDGISTEMAILSIMDIYDALTAHDRPYKKAVSPEKALGIIKSMSEEGKLNTELVNEFERLLLAK
jgi:HD-GYP domain-containing protein (c-di-GMP phosphodiesterase class II)